MVFKAPDQPRWKIPLLGWYVESDSYNAQGELGPNFHVSYKK